MNYNLLYRNMNYESISASGACAVGFASVGETPPEIMSAFGRWLSEGNAAGMGYLHNHIPIRRDPGLLLEDTRTVISLAFPYYSSRKRENSLPQLASYALGSDYHDALRSRLQRTIEALKSVFGGEYRICIDSAPIFERHWAERCGIGTRCDNGLISVPGFGTRVFLAEILSTVDFPLKGGFLLSGDRPAAISTDREGCAGNQDGREPAPITQEILAGWSCTHCGACRRACPAGALQTDSTVDARRCLSYLTIEHRGEWDEEGRAAMSTAAGRRTLYGCDLCQNACPLNRRAETERPDAALPEFRPRPELLTLTAEAARALTQTDFSQLFRGSPVKRAKLAGLLRNAANILEAGDE